MTERPGSRIENKFETVNLSGWKIKQKRVAVVNFGVNERSSNSRSSSMINHVFVCFGVEVGQ